MIPIPYAMTYTSTVKARVVKSVACESCHTEYIYVMERQASGQGTSMLFLDNSGASSRAQAEAEKLVMRKLEYDFDPVPCPACGWYQAFMIPKMRRLKWRWMTPVEVMLILAGVVVFIASMAVTFEYNKWQTDAAMFNMALCWTIFATIVIVAVALPVVKYRTFRHFDPNLEPQDARIAAGRSRAITLAEYEAAQNAEPEA